MRVPELCYIDHSILIEEVNQVRWEMLGVVVANQWINPNVDKPTIIDPPCQTPSYGRKGIYYSPPDH